MTDYSEFKRLAEAALNDNGDYVALNDYGMAVPPAVVLDLIAEVEALRKDAERYRWTAIKGNWVAFMFGKWRAHIGEYGDANPTDWFDTREDAIDAAMNKGSKP